MFPDPDQLRKRHRHDPPPGTMFHCKVGGFPVAQAAYQIKAVAHDPDTDVSPFHLAGVACGLPFELQGIDAARFLQRVGVLRRCQGCGQQRLIFEPDSDICAACGYRAV